jgi:hypothetical protein
MASKFIWPMAVVAAGIVGVSGSSLINSALASADTTSNTAVTSTSDDSSNTTRDLSKSGHQANGKTEELLTSDTADKAKAAALAAVPGATVERAETDVEGAAYEVHLTKTDGSHVTIKLDGSFKVTATEDGSNRGGGRGHGSHDSSDDNGTDNSSSSSSSSDDNSSDSDSSSDT